MMPEIQLIERVQTRPDVGHPDRDGPETEHCKQTDADRPTGFERVAEAERDRTTATGDN